MLSLKKPSASIRLARNLAATIGLSAALVACATPQTSETLGSGPEASRYSAEDEAIYLARFNSLAEGGSGGAGLGSYDPLEPVAGASEIASLPTSQSAALSADTLAKAEQYAAVRNSSAFLVWHEEAIAHETYFGDFTQSTPIVSKSLAKPLTALLVGRALMQGYIESLDQPVADFITEWQGDAEREKILVRHLLDMRTGFIPQAMAMEPEDVLNRAYLHPRHVEVIIHDYPLASEPGTRYEYANATSEMVAPVIERATGMRYSEYVTSALLEPLGAAGGSVWVNREGGMAHSGCCILLPARTWLSMGVLLLEDGVWEGTRLLPEGYVQEMSQGTEENPHYGMGVWVAGPYLERRGYAHPSVPFGKVLHSEPYADKDLFLFDGNGNQVVYIVPSTGTVILRTGARPPSDAEWDNPYLPNLLIRDIVNNTGVPMPEAQSQ